MSAKFLWHCISVWSIVFTIHVFIRGSLSALHAVVPRSSLVSGTFFCGKNQEEQVVSYWEKNGHLILVNCLREACPGTV